MFVWTAGICGRGQGTGGAPGGLWPAGTPGSGAAGRLAGEGAASAGGKAPGPGGDPAGAGPSGLCPVADSGTLGPAASGSGSVPSLLCPPDHFGRFETAENRLAHRHRGSAGTAGGPGHGPVCPAAMPTGAPGGGKRPPRARGRSCPSGLRREYGLPVQPDGAQVSLAVYFDGEGAGEGDLLLWGPNPQLWGVVPRAPGLMEEDQEDLGLLTALWETGKLGSDALEFT